MPEPTQSTEPIKYTHLLRVEGVNHDQFIFDTTDLSTIRGGGLLMLDAATKVLGMAEHFVPDAVEVSSGASSALIALNVAGSDANNIVDQIVANVRGMHATNETFKHATFVVDSIETKGDFQLDREAVLAKNRRAQMKSPSLQFPSRKSAEVCATDRIRPADPKTKTKDLPAVSDSVDCRRRYGRGRKQSFYVDEIAKVNSAIGAKLTAESARTFARDFSQIAEDSSRGNLNNKLAVFYADGNSFGTHQRAKSADTLRGWDCKIKKLRRTLLAKIIDERLTHEKYSADDPIRFETLLWGGDEMLFVMPAWQGLAFVESFFSSTTGWTFGGEALTHAVGLVFCHHNAPIHAVKGVAERLAISAKDTTNRKGNSINYVVLESFDHTGTDWNDYLKRVYNGQLFAACRCLSAADFASTLAALRTLKHGLPRARVAPYIQSLIAGNADPDKAEKRRDHDLDEATKSAASALCAPHTNCPLAGWSHCADLWDYLDDGAAQ